MLFSQRVTHVLLAYVLSSKGVVPLMVSLVNCGQG